MQYNSEIQSLVSGFLKSVDQVPEHNALWVNNKFYTYRDFFNTSAQIAGLLKQTSVYQSSNYIHCTLLCEKDKIESYASVLGILLSQGVYVPLNINFPYERNAYIVEQSESEIILYDCEGAKQIKSILTTIKKNLTLIALDHEQDDDLIQGFPECKFISLRNSTSLNASNIVDYQPDLNKIAYILYTSGSTGQPKGVAISHQSASAYVANIVDYFKVNAEDRCTQFFDFTFDLSIHDMFVTWTAGACLYSIPKNYYFIPNKFIKEHEISIWFSVPSVVATMQKLGVLKQEYMPSLRYSLFCGEALSTTLAEAWLKCAPNAKTFNLYGPTEATIAFTIFPVTYSFIQDYREKMGIVPIGYPLVNQECILLDEEGKEIKDNSIGELCLGGNQLALNYWNNPVANAAFFKGKFLNKSQQRWYRTGDLARLDSRFGLIYCGRKDRQVKIRGYRIELQEVEAVIKRYSGSELVAALPISSDSKNYDQIISFICMSNVHPNLLNELRQYLPDYMLPSRIISIDSMPLNSNGKIDYNALKKYI